MAKHAAQLLRTDGKHCKYTTPGDLWGLIDEGWAEVVSMSPLVGRLLSRRSLEVYKKGQESNPSISREEMEIYATGSSRRKDTWVSKDRYAQVRAKVDSFQTTFQLVTA